MVLNEVPYIQDDLICLCTQRLQIALYALCVLQMENMLALVLAENVIMHLHLIDGGVLDGETTVRHTFLFALDDFLSPLQQVFLGG